MSGIPSGMTPENEFDLGFDDGSDDPSEIGPNAEILPDAPYVGGQHTYSNIHGAGAHHVAGRATSPKLFAQAALFPQCTQLRCWHIVNGVPTGLGTIDSNASEEDFVQTFSSAMPKSGEGSFKFKLRPLDIDGRELGQELTLIISEHHSAITKSPSVTGVENPVNGTMNSVIGMLEKTLAHSQKALEEERTRTQELMAQMGQERIDLASNAASGVQIISERMMEADAKRHESQLRQEQMRNQQMQDNMAAFFSSQSEMQKLEREKQSMEWERQRDRDQTQANMMLQLEQQRRDREAAEARERLQYAKQEQAAARERENAQFQMTLEQERQRRERESQEFREKLEVMRREWEVKQSQERAEYERREAQRKEEQRELHRKREFDAKQRDLERQRQHEMRLKELELAAQRDREHAERMMQLQALQVQQEKSGSFKETIKDAMETMMSIGLEPTELIQRLMAPPDSGANTESIMTALTGMAGKVAEVMKENAKGQATVQAAQAHAQAQHAQTQAIIAHQSQQNQHAALTTNPMHEQEQFAQQQMQQMFEQQQFMEEEESEEEEIQLPLAAQKSARKALRQLVKVLRNSPQDQWEDHIAQAITSEPSIYHYMQAVSLATALKEAGSPKDLIQTVIKLLQESPLVPNEINYGVP